MIRSLLVACALVLAAPAGRCLAQAPDAALTRALEEELAARKFSGILELQVDGQRRYSYASKGGGSTARCDVDSVFWLGSVSKQFAAVAALRLVDQGKLSLERLLASYLPRLSAALTRDGASCTVAQVLHHTCGLPASNVCHEIPLDSPSGQAAFIDCVAKLSLRSRPGANYAYANVGFDLIGVLVAERSGSSYAAFLQQELLRPLGMTSTGVDLRRHPAALSRLVQGQLFNGWTWSNTWPWLGRSPTGPGTTGAAGNIFSTVADLHRWNQALHGGRILQPESYQRLITPALEDYGLGLVVERSEGGTRWLWHNGSLTPLGWSAFVAYVPALRASVVGLANRTRHTSQLMGASRALVLATLGAKLPRPLLEQPATRDRAVELLFWGMLLLWLGTVALLCWQLWRGPRRQRPLLWQGKLLTQAALYLLLSSLFELHRTVYLALPLLGVTALGLILHRRHLDLALAASWRDKKQRHAVLSLVLASGALLFVSPWTARGWFAALVLLQAAVVALFALRPPWRKQRPTPHPRRA